MKLRQFCTLSVLLLLLSACAGRHGPGVDGADRDSAATIAGLIGMLIVSDPDKCPLADGCGPQFSLLGPQLESRVALRGNIRPQHHHLILSVTGVVTELPPELAAKPGYEQVKAMVTVESYRVRSQIPYHAFIAERMPAVIEEHYGCNLLWDQSYRWTTRNQIPLLTVRLTDPATKTPESWIELTFNGHSGKLRTHAVNPPGLQPCGP